MLALSRIIMELMDTLFNFAHIIIGNTILFFCLTLFNFAIFFKFEEDAFELL